MKMKFRGWSREVYSHVHEVKPVVKKGSKFSVGTMPDISASNDEVRFLGRVVGLGLSGDFLVEFTLSNDDLNQLVQKKVLSDPLASISYLADLQAQVFRAAFQTKADHGL